MPKPKKTVSNHVRLPEKAQLKIEEYARGNIASANNEIALATIDGLIAREFLSEQWLKDSRKKYL